MTPPRIDAHQHFWRYAPAEYAWIDESLAALRRDFVPDEAAQDMARAGFHASVAVQACHTREETSWLLSLAGRHTFIAGVVGWVDLQADDVRAQLQQAASNPHLVGIRHIVQSETDDRFLLRPAFCRGIGMLEEFGLTYDILVYARHLPVAAEFVEHLPKQRFVLDHLAKPDVKSQQLQPWEAAIRTLAKFNNVVCKLSGLVTEADWNNWRAEDFRPYLDVVFEAFGTERLMFGSDWPVCLLAGTYKDVKQLTEDYIRDLPERERHNIFGLNAARFYGLRSSA